MSVSDYKYGYNLDNYEKDGLIAAWGARAILNDPRLNSSSGRIFEFVPGRVSVIGDKVLTDCIIKIISKYSLYEAMSNFVRDNYRENQGKVLTMWDETHRTNPLDVKVRIAGGYVYLRVGIRKPEPIAKHRDYDLYQEVGSPEGETIWYSDTRPEIGSVGLHRGQKATMLTYVSEGCFQYGMCFNEAFLSKESPQSRFFGNGKYPYGRPWSFCVTVMASEWVSLDSENVREGA